MNIRRAVRVLVAEGSRRVMDVPVGRRRKRVRASEVLVGRRHRVGPRRPVVGHDQLRRESPVILELLVQRDRARDLNVHRVAGLEARVLGDRSGVRDVGRVDGHPADQEIVLAEDYAVMADGQLDDRDPGLVGNPRTPDTDPAAIEKDVARVRDSLRPVEGVLLRTAVREDRHADVESAAVEDEAAGRLRRRLADRVRGQPAHALDQADFFAAPGQIRDVRLLRVKHIAVGRKAAGVARRLSSCRGHHHPGKHRDRKDRGKAQPEP